MAGKRTRSADSLMFYEPPTKFLKTIQHKEENEVKQDTKSQELIQKAEVPESTMLQSKVCDCVIITNFFNN